MMIISCGVFAFGLFFFFLAQLCVQLYTILCYRNLRVSSISLLPHFSGSLYPHPLSLKTILICGVIEATGLDYIGNL